jgi:hypothetical protein
MVLYRALLTCASSHSPEALGRTHCCHVLPGDSPVLAPMGRWRLVDFAVVAVELSTAYEVMAHWKVQVSFSLEGAAVAQQDLDGWGGTHRLQEVAHVDATPQLVVYLK